VHTALSGTSSLCGPSHQLSVNKLLYYSVSTNGGAEAQIHNGNLTNPEALRDELTVGDAFSRYLRTSSDSEVLLNVFADALHKVRFSSQLKPLGCSELVSFRDGAYFACTRNGGADLAAATGPRAPYGLCGYPRSSLKRRRRRRDGTDAGGFALEYPIPGR